MTLQQRLFGMADEEFRKFHTKLCPTVRAGTIIGVKTPELRRLARELKKENAHSAFLGKLPHRYYEENQIHGFLLSELTDFDEVIRELERFLPYVDNWATCDAIRPKVFFQNRDRLLREVEGWLASEAAYIQRFGIEMMMVHFLDDDFQPDYLARVARIRSGEYYVNMMLAWYFATALAKQYVQTLPILTENRLDTWVHNKTIQKARESYRISKEQKAYLSTLKRKQVIVSPDTAVPEVR